MDKQRFQAITAKYRELRVAVAGDFCLDRYLEIDPERHETSIETGLPVHNVVNVRAQAGGAGTILNNLAALGVGKILPVGVVGRDGEGFELERALECLGGVSLTGLIRTSERRTFTYCKPLLVGKDKPPVELSRLDSKNWTRTPQAIEQELSARLRQVIRDVDGLVVLDQVDLAGSGVVTSAFLDLLAEIAHELPALPILADSRRGLSEFPPVIFKMNSAELGRLTKASGVLDPGAVREAAGALARSNHRPVFVTLAEQGAVGATPAGEMEHVPAYPVRGQIDVVGAGDAVSANLICALCAGAGLRETLELANAAASVVIHKLGTTGTASVAELEGLLFPGG
jgi:rfaE bifunctional protein kinase chain/domain